MQDGEQEASEVANRRQGGNTAAVVSKWADGRA